MSTYTANNAEHGRDTVSFYAPDDNPQGEWVEETLRKNHDTIIAGLYSIGEIEEWAKADDRAETLMLQYAERNWRDHDYNMDADGFLSDLDVNLKDAQAFAAFLELNGMFDRMTDAESCVFNYSGTGIYEVHKRIAAREAFNADNVQQVAA